MHEDDRSYTPKHAAENPVPPSSGSGVTCAHDFAHLHTEYERVEGGYNDSFSRHDTFFCRRCLATERRRTAHEDSRGLPIWWKR